MRLRWATTGAVLSKATSNTRAWAAYEAKHTESAEFLIAIGEKAESTHSIRIVPSAVDYWVTTTYARERNYRKWWLRQHQ